MEIEEHEDVSSKNGNNARCYSRGMMHQLLNVGAVVLYGATLGATMGYSAILLPQIQGNGTYIHIDEEMGSWIASLQSGVSPFGTVLGGLSMDRWGRRFTMRVGVLPLFLGYLTIAFAPNYQMILIGRFITGITAGFSAAASSVILCEIATTRLRGLYASSTYTAVSVGILLVYALGTYLQWNTVAGLLAILPLSSFILFLFVPESPVWLAKKGKTEDAEKALLWLRGNENKAKLELQELMSTIKEQDLDDNDSDTSDEDSHGKYKRRIMHQIQSLTSPSLLKPFFIAHIFNLFQILTGTLLVVFYAVDIISGINKDAEEYSHFIAVLTALVRLVFTIITNLLLYYIWRRMHAVVACSICAVTAIALSSFLYISPRTNIYVTATLIAIFIAGNTCAFLPLPAAIMSEILPIKIRGVGCGYIYAANDVLQFFVSKMYPSMKNKIGTHGLFLLFGINALVCAIFAYMLLPETRGKSLAQIEEYFRGRNLLWIKRDKRLGRDYTRKRYFEMKKSNLKNNGRKDLKSTITTYTEQEKTAEIDVREKRDKRKLSVTFS